MIPVPKKYANRPNLWQVACELSTFKAPYKVLDLILAAAVPMLEQEKNPQ